MAGSKRRGHALSISIVAGCLLAALVGIAGPPAAADPTDLTVTKIDGTVVDTDISSECAKAGTGPGVKSHAHWGNVDQGTNIEATDAHEFGCAQAITNFILQLARDEHLYSATVPQQLRSQLLSGTVNLSDPYEVFLDNIYVTTSAIATLDTSTAPSATGLGSCELDGSYLLVTCIDDTLGSIMLRDDWGNPIRDWANQPIYFNLNGLLSQRGGTTYGNLFLINDDNSPDDFDERVEHHEQVHSQQWSQYGWDFARRYIQDFVDSAGNANYNHWLYGPTQNVQVPSHCYQFYERQAGFQDGNYAFRDVDHDGASSPATAGTNNRYVTTTGAYPAGWTTAINNGWNDTGSLRWLKCPSNWK